MRKKNLSMRKHQASRFRLSAAGVSLFCASTFSVQAAPLPGGSLNPLLIPKYVTSLVIPPEMPSVGTNSNGVKMYDIEMLQFRQQILPPRDIKNNKLNSTMVWTYGSTGNKVTHTYPAFSIEAQKDREIQVIWRNSLVDNSGKPLPHLLPVDRSLHWANPERLPCVETSPNGTDCRPDPVVNKTLLQKPYTGPVPMITHVHGAHVSSMSDGYPEAWYLPASTNCKKFSCLGAKANQLTDMMGNVVANTVAGSANFSYSNDQSSTTLWYHDHTLGMTRANVYAGPAGFWLIREANGGETGLVSGTLPGPAPKAGDAAGKSYFEIPIMIQDRSFNTSGQLFYPSNRAFFENLEPGSLKIPFIGDEAYPSDISAIWNPEAFFNVMVVNGRSWPYHNVEPQRYRLRLLNGSNSRFLNLSLVALDANGVMLGEVPFYQIGSDQGLLPQVVRTVSGESVALAGDGTEPALPNAYPAPGDAPALLLGPAERADVIVDFSNLPANTNVVRMLNTGPDEPYGGFPLAPADADTTGQVMQFVVVADNPATVDNSTAPKNLVLAGAGTLVANAPVRELSLNERESSSVCANDSTGIITAINLMGEFFDPMDPNNICYQAGGFPMAPQSALLGTFDQVQALPMPQMWGDPITQNPQLGAVETWALNNFTEDAHPIHVHLVKFRIMDRVDASGIARDPEPSEMGWKDTVVAYPGETTHIQAKFDVPGLFVWHCHILEHEDNEMMLPYCVGDSAGCAHPVSGNL